MRVFIIDGQLVFREGLETILAAHREIFLVGSAATVEAALPFAGVAEPDLFVVDFELSGRKARELTAVLRRCVPAADVLILTASAVVQDLIDGFAAGALGYALKTETGEAVVTAIRRVARGQNYVTPCFENIFARLRRSHFPATLVGVLSPREQVVFRLVTAGQSTADIAAEFGVSRKTIETHKHRIMRKFGVASTAELVRFAALQRLLVPEGRPPVTLEPEATVPNSADADVPA
jgi:DNA-binding NarL/FixJ family response regulator